MVFPIAPQILDRVEFGSVGRKVLHSDLTLQRIEEFSDEFTAMSRQPIPDDQQGPSQILQQVS
jgi:hypothetical protein